MNRFYYFVPFVLQNLFFVTFLPLYKFFIQLEVKGKENLKNLTGPIIIAPNHTSELDPTAIPLIFPFLSKYLPIYSVIYPIAKYKTPEWRWRRYIYGRLFFNLLGGYSSYSGSKDYNVSLKDHLILLRKGRTVCIFPEGKCTTDGNLHPAHGGLGFLTFHTNATVVPLVIDTFYGLTLFEFIRRRVKITLTILPPLTKEKLFSVSEPTVEDYKNASQEVMDKIRQEIENPKINHVVNDISLNLETPTFFRSIFHFFLIPFLNNLPKKYKRGIAKTHKSAEEVIKNVTTHHALEVLYSKGQLFSAKNLLQKFFQNIWFNMDNSRAVRNRLKLVKKELEEHLRLIADTDRQINILSIASGSSRAIIEVVENGHYLRDAKLSLTFLDKSPDAIAYSKKLSTKLQHLPLHMEWINDSAGEFLRNPPLKKFDVIEIVGLLDYFTDEKIVEMFKGIHAILEEGGIVITANINHNNEEKFISNVIDWTMIYRRAEDLGNLLTKSGFMLDKMKIYYEPFKVHGMVVAKK